MDSGNGNTNDLLERIAQGVELIAERVEQLEVRVERNHQETSGRLDNMIGFLGTHHSDHEQRIAALETHVFKKSG